MVVDEGKLTTVDLRALVEEGSEIARQASADNRAAREQYARPRSYFEEMHRRAVAVDFGFNASLPRR